MYHHISLEDLRTIEEYARQLQTAIVKPEHFITQMYILDTVREGILSDDTIPVCSDEIACELKEELLNNG